MGATGFVQVFSSEIATVAYQTKSEHFLCFSKKLITKAMYGVGGNYEMWLDFYCVESTLMG